MTVPLSPLLAAPRLCALRRLSLLDTGAEPGFDRITHLAADVLRVPVCLVSFVDERRQFFKSAFGLQGPVEATRETPLSHSFCQHVVTSGVALVVPDAMAHPQVCDNPAIRELGVRAYLGAPVHSPDGFVLGSICVTDAQPRRWTPRDVELMTEFAALVDTEIAKRAASIDKAAALAQQRAVLDGTIFSVIATTPEGLIEEFNVGAERMLGYAAGEMIGRQTPVMLHLPEEVAARAAELSALLGREVEAGFEAFVAQARLGHVDEREWTYVRQDGSRLPVLLSITRLTDKAGVITGFLGVAQDLTARRKAEMALRASEERLKQVLSRANCLMWEAQVELTEHDWAWRMTVHSSGLYRHLWGGEAAVASVGLWYQFDIPEQQEMNRRSRAAMESGAPGYEQEFRLRREGQVVWIRESVAITRTAPGHYWLVGVAVDVTEHKQAELARAEIVARLDKLGSQVPGMIYQFRLRPDGTGSMPYASESVRQIYHVTPEEVREDAKTIFAVLHPDDVSAVKESIWASARTLQRWQNEHRVWSPQGGERWVLGNAMPEREADGSVLWHGFITDITERKHAEREMRLNAERVRLAAEAAGVAVWEWDLATDRFSWDARMFEIYGLPPSATGEVSHATWSAAVHPADIAVQEAQLTAVVATGSTSRRKFRIRRGTDGAIRFVQAVERLVRDDHGKALRVVGVNIDITEREEAEEKLVQSEGLLATVTGMIPGLVAYWTADLRCAFANGAYREWFGRTPAEMHGMRMQDLLGAELFRKNEPYIRAVLEGKPQQFERQLTKTNGDVRETWAQYIPDIRAEGGVKGFAVLVADVTEIKGKEQALRASEAELGRQKFALDQHAIVAVTDVDGRITYANDKFCRLSQYSREELVGRTHRVINSGHHPRTFFAAMFRAITAGKVWHGEICNRAKDGSLYWEESTIVPFRSPAGAITSYVAIRSDITERKRLEHNLAIARDQALEASRLKSEFLAMMSHEIRTPMNAIIGMAGLLAETPLNPDQMDMARTLAGGAESLLAIINDILDFSRIEAGQLRLDPADFDLRRIVEETVALLAPRAREKGLALGCEFAPAPDCLLLGDGGRVRQILTNLIGNAVKFTDAGEVVVATGVLGATGERVRVRAAVRDTGIGIPEEARDRLFRPFVQVDGSSTRRFGGTGLGLAITRQLVAAMGGEIGFDSEPGRGSTFWVELEFPRRDLLVTTTHALPATETPSESTVRLHLLLVEDNRANQQVASLLLTRMGHTVVVTANGQQALDRLALEAFDAVLMDCQMPVLDGYAATRQIRAGEVAGINPRLPIIALTAYARAEDRARCFEAGMTAYVSKPIRVGDLQAALEQCGFGHRPVAPAVWSATGPALDAEVVATVRSLPGAQGASLLPELIEVYLSDEPARLARMGELAEEKAALALAEAAHGFGGNAASFGGSEVRLQALELERAARAFDWSDVAACLVRLRQAAERLRAEVEHFRIRPQ